MKVPKKWAKLVVAAGVVGLAALPAAAGEEYHLGVPEIAEGEQSAYRVTFVDREEKSFAIDGDLSNLEGFTYQVFPYQEDGKDYYRVLEVERIKGGLRNEFATEFERGAYMRLLRYTETLYSYTGKMIRTHTSDYDDPLFKFPGPTILTHVITFWLRGIDFAEGRVSTFYLMLLGDASPPWRIWAKVGPVEELEVPAGRFSCYKVTIVPDMGHILGKWKWAAFIINPLIPDFFIWYATEPPHPMVKFEGALGVKGITAVQIHELTSYQKAQDAALTP